MYCYNISPYRDIIVTDCHILIMKMYRGLDVNINVWEGSLPVPFPGS